MKKYLLLFTQLFVICFAGNVLIAENNSKVVYVENGVYIYTPKSTLKIEIITDSILHVTASPDIHYISNSLIINHVPKKTAFSVDSTNNQLTISTSAIQVKYNSKTDQISFFNKKDNQLLVSEANAGRSFSPTDAPDKGYYKIEQKLILSPQEGFYGLGQYQDGDWNRRHKKVNLVQANMEFAVPMFVSSKGYGILWDNYSKTIFDDTSNEAMSISSEVANAIDYYVIFGGSVDNTVAQYRQLTGNVPMFPRSFFGFWQSKERYKSFNELTNVVKEYRKRNIPIDNIVLDWSYWGKKELWNSMSFNKDSFPNPAQAIENLHKNLDVKLTISVWPSVGPETEIYKEMENAGVLFNEPTWAGYKVIDMFNPIARDIYWKYLHKGLYNVGVDGWWFDATEPSFREGFTQDRQEEISKSAGKTYMGSFAKMLNAYSLAMMNDMYDRFRAESNNRVVILTRSVFASQQHYGAAIWSGDVSASWKTFRNQIPEGLNMSLSGIPYWNSDIGAFFIKDRGGEFPKGLEDPEYKELYVRWFQLGAFSPMFRAHGSHVPREPWQFGKEGEPFYDAQIEMINTRYRLMPYIYSTSWMVTNKNYTMARPLIMDFPNDSIATTLGNSYMFGPSILVAPVQNSMYYGKNCNPKKPKTKVDVYLPLSDKNKKEYWYDFNNPANVYNAGKTIKYDAPLKVLPLFVRSGAIIPTQNAMKNAQSNPDSYTIDIYAGSDGTFSLFIDDGNTYNYEKGIYTEIPMYWNDSKRTLTINQQSGSFLPENSSLKFKVILHNLKITKNSTTTNIQQVDTIYQGKKIELNL